ncbi:MAG: STN domain-containing protein [Candidatus Brocadiia bacterium]
MRLILTVLSILIAGIYLALAANGDEIILKSGAKIQGEAVRNGDELRVRTENGDLTISMSRVRRILSSSKPGVVRQKKAVVSDSEEEGGVRIRSYTPPATSRDLPDFLRRVEGKKRDPKNHTVSDEMVELLTKKVELKLKKGTLKEIEKALEEATEGTFVIHPQADKSARVLKPGTVKGSVRELLARMAQTQEGGSKIVGKFILLGVREKTVSKKEYPEVRRGPRVIVVEEREIVPSKVAKQLNRRISVDFDETPLPEALQFIKEITGLNFAYRSSDLETKARPVTLKVKNVSVRQILDLLLDNRGLGWQIQGTVVRIQRAKSSKVRKSHGYNVVGNVPEIRDHWAPGNTSILDQSDEDDDDMGSNELWGGGSWNDDDDSEEDRHSERTRTPSERISNLAGLITKTVEPDSWQKPAAIVVGWSDESEQRDANIWD